MDEIQADASGIDAVLVQAMAGDLPGSVCHPLIPVAARRFLRTTQDLIREGDVDALAAAFAYGRELIVPDLFRSLLARLQLIQLPCPTLCWYLERHIELDGDSHGPLAEQMVQALMGSDPIACDRVQRVRTRVISDRESFWDALHGQLANPVLV